MQRFPLWTTLLIGTWLLAFSEVRAQAPKTAEQPAFSKDQIEQLVAPIALYPDSVVAQVLMASTYPLEIVQASRWREKNPKLKGNDLEQALATQSWDPSVKALTNFPDVLKDMSDNLDWTQDLGDAMLAQEKDVMDAVQHMRRLAYDTGNLKTTPEQKVVVQEKTIVVEPAKEVIYVPAYNPTVVYGSAWAPATYYYPMYSYPPSYWYPPGYAASNIISFGVGMAVGAAIWGNWNWGHCNWHGGSVNINNNFNFNRNINTRNVNMGNRVGGGRYSNWQHNVNHRGGVRYRDASTRQRYAAAGDRSRQARINRDTARGFDRGGSRQLARADTRTGQRAGSREQRRPESRDLRSSQSRDVRRPQTSSTGRASDRSVSRQAPRAQTQDRTSRSTAGRSSAFNVGGGSFDRAASSRGASSRGASGRSAGGMSRGGGAARGGGGRRGR